MNPSSASEYDFKKDSAVIAVDHEAGLHDKDLPWVIYLSGVHVASMDSFQRACEHAQKMGWLGRCTIRDVFAEPPTLGPLFGAGYESGYAKAREEGAEILRAARRTLDAIADTLRTDDWPAMADMVQHHIDAIDNRLSRALPSQDETT